MVSDFKFSHRRRVVAVLLLAVFAGGILLLPRIFRRENPLVTTPELALEAALPMGKLYYNAAARPWLLAARPELLEPEDRDGRSDRSRALAQAAVNPKLFRQLDRRWRFDTLLLVGDPSQYRALLDHLVETKDFTLTYVDHTSVIFRRDGSHAWSPAALEPWRQRLAGAAKKERASCLALTASKLLAARRTPEAKALLDEAQQLDGAGAEAAAALATYHLDRGEWAEAVAAADRALQADWRNLGALSTKTQAFYSTKHFNEAYQLSKELVAKLPDDPNILFKHAQIAHEAHAFTAEIEALEHLVALAEKNERPTTGYRVYLAQAYTAAGKAKPAIENFDRALADPELPQDQKKFAQDSIARIKSRTGM